MNRSTQAISLVLLGTALAMSGCSQSEDEDQQQNGGGGAHGAYMGTRVGGYGAGRGVGSVGVPSARGGFGGTGGFGGIGGFSGS